METNQFTYTIGEKKYFQRPLVLGQINQLLAVTRGMVFPKDAGIPAIIGALGSRLATALAIVLLEADEITDEGRTDGKKPISLYLKDRELQPLAEEIEFNIDPDTTAQVIEDFFDCNPIPSLLEKFGSLGEKIRGLIKTKDPTSSSPSSSSFPGETSPVDAGSSGPAPLESADRT